MPTDWKNVFNRDAGYDQTATDQDTDLGLFDMFSNILQNQKLPKDYFCERMQKSKNGIIVRSLQKSKGTRRKKGKVARTVCRNKKKDKTFDSK